MARVDVVTAGGSGFLVWLVLVCLLVAYTGMRVVFRVSRLSVGFLRPGAFFYEARRRSVGGSSWECVVVGVVVVFTGCTGRNTCERWAWVARPAVGPFGSAVLPLVIVVSLFTNATATRSGRSVAGVSVRGSLVDSL